MKKTIRITALAIALSIAICGCNYGEANGVLKETNSVNKETNGTVKELNAEAAEKYEIGTSNPCFDYDEEGNLYAMTVEDSGEVMEYPNGLEVPIFHTILSVISPNGEKIGQYVFDEEVSSHTLECCGDAVYYIVRCFIDDIEVTALKKYTFGESSWELIHCFGEFEYVESTALIDNVLYILGTDSSNKDGEGYSDDSYRNSGEIVAAYDLTNDKVTALFNKGALKMSETPQGTLMIYAHDNDGYFFIEYDPNGGFSEKQYKDLDMLNGFAVCGEDRYIYSNVYTAAAIASFKDEGKADIAVEGYIFGDVKVSSAGKMCYTYSDYSEDSLDILNSYLVNMDISSALKIDLSDKLTMISAEFVYETPPSLGFSMTHDTVNYDSFALTVLSQDPQYDMYIASSRSTFAENIKSKGSFYPLNDVEGVREYIDSCIPCLKEAAVNDDGDIWMIPVDIKIPYLAYSEKMCGDISGMTAEELISLINNMYSDKEKADTLGNFNAYFISELMLSNYLFGSTDFDTEKFRYIAKIVKEDIFPSGAFDSELSSALQKAYSTGDYSGISLNLGYHESDHTFFSASGARVTELPMLTNNPVPATCVFVCVNPTSRNLGQALEYISALAEYFNGSDNCLMRENSRKYSKSSYYQDLKEVYKNAEVRFSYSNEILLSDFYGYAEGNISLDDFIKEANRKLSAYLNE
ncbi:MAG: hypothetical protein HDT47_07245 [Ruminococcaceae bacterium]|nr:hypothetical protein [Oscillospiraceae bacterium]